MRSRDLPKKLRRRELKMKREESRKRKEDRKSLSDFKNNHHKFKKEMLRCSRKESWLSNPGLSSLMINT